MLTIDCHTHIIANHLQVLYQRAMAGGVDLFNILGVPALCGAGNNFECMKAKFMYPGKAYVYGGLVWQGQDCPQPREQLKMMMEAGFDGLKLIESKPNLQKDLQFDPSSPHFEGMFALAVKEGFPLLWHVGDPASFWRRETAPAFAVENGWTYDGKGFASLETLYEQVEAVLQRHPRLKVILAHFYFCSDDASHLERLLDRFPNVSVDITPGVEMYHEFARSHAFWQEFFERRAKRILLGSDLTDEPGDAHYLSISRIIRGMLSKEPFEVWDIKTRGFDLSDQALEHITGKNFMAICASLPKEPRPDGLKAMLGLYRQILDANDYTAALAAFEECAP